MSQIIISVLSILAALITAVATIALWRVTKVLADETRRMATATAQPQIVMTIESNDWSYIHADLCISNTGNSTAFDIEIIIDPVFPIKSADGTLENSSWPFQRISLLKPGHKLSSWIGAMSDYLEERFHITVYWRAHPDKERECYSYTLDMGMYKNAGRLGSGNPAIQIANAVQSMKEDIHRVIRSGRINVDAFSQEDRQRDVDAWSETPTRNGTRTREWLAGRFLATIEWLKR